MSRGNVKYFLAFRKNKFAIVKDLCYNVPNRIGGAVMTTKQIIEMALAYKDMSKVDRSLIISARNQEPVPQQIFRYA